MRHRTLHCIASLFTQASIGRLQSLRIAIRMLIAAATVSALLLGHPTVGFSQDEQATVAWGKDLFQTHCVACHGLSGKGDGPVGATLKVPPTDLTQLSKKNGGSFPTRQIRKFIDGERPIPAHGSREMPIWGKVFRGEKTDTEARMQIFALSAFLKSIQEE